jgi:hypothetical protein
MRNIRISDEVWIAIAERGKFGETEDDVLRRVFDLEPSSKPTFGRRGTGRVGRGGKRFSTNKMSPRVENNKLVVEFEEGQRQEWTLPNRGEKEEIRRVRDEAVVFAKECGATDPGQTNAVRKTLTDNGYHLTK